MTMGEDCRLAPFNFCGEKLDVNLPQQGAGESKHVRPFTPGPSLTTGHASRHKFVIRMPPGSTE
jgi:hypothetical protein